MSPRGLGGSVNARAQQWKSALGPSLSHKAGHTGNMSSITRHQVRFRSHQVWVLSTRWYIHADVTSVQTWLREGRFTNGYGHVYSIGQAVSWGCNRNVGTRCEGQVSSVCELSDWQCE